LCCSCSSNTRSMSSTDGLRIKPGALASGSDGCAGVGAETDVDPTGASTMGTAGVRVSGISRMRTGGRGSRSAGSGGETAAAAVTSVVVDAGLPVTALSVCTRTPDALVTRACCSGDS
jgi:hypothetical protein